jgi:hypothetical protein
VTPQGTLGTRRAPIFARLSPTGGLMAAVAVVVAMVLTGCDSVSAAITPTAATPTVTAASLPQVRVQATDYHYDMHATVPAGLVAITQTNSGAQPHQVIISRLKAGVSDQQMVDAFPGEEAKIDALSTFAGGPGIVAPGGAQAVVVSLQPGRYVVYCFLTAPDGMAHFAKGMYHFFTVAKTSASVMRGQLAAQGTLNLRDFAFAMPTNGVAAGQTTLKVVNQGSEPHELVIVKVATGKTVQDVITWVHTTPPAAPPSRPPPYTPAGGLEPIAPGAASWVLLDLQPGQYVALCYVLDPATSKPHVDLGMIAPFMIH